MKAKDMILILNGIYEKYKKCIDCDAWRYDKKQGVYSCSLQKDLPCIHGGERVDEKKEG